MWMNEYQKAAKKTAIYPTVWSVVYPAMGLASEAGEVAGKVKKMMRDGEHDRLAIAKELGDVLWYVAVLASDLGYTMEEVARMNQNKLTDRCVRGTLRGSGDER